MGKIPIRFSGCMFAVGLQLCPWVCMAQIPPGVIDRPSEQPLPAPEFLPDKDIKPFELPPLERPDEVPAEGEPQLDVERFVFDGNQVIPTEKLERVAEP